MFSVFITMEADERNRQIRLFAHGFAAEHHKRLNHGCGEDAAWRYAERHGRAFVPGVCDWMALCDAAEDAEQSAPWN